MQRPLRDETKFSTNWIPKRPRRHWLRCRAGKPQGFLAEDKTAAAGVEQNPKNPSEESKTMEETTLKRVIENPAPLRDQAGNDGGYDGTWISLVTHEEERRFVSLAQSRVSSDADTGQGF